MWYGGNWFLIAHSDFRMEDRLARMAMGKVKRVLCRAQVRGIVRVYPRHVPPEWHLPHCKQGLPRASPQVPQTTPGLQGP